MAAAVFISYARNDHLKPVLENAPQGWVTFFWQQLRVALTDSGLPEARLWIDRFEIDPTEEFTPKIEAAEDARLLIPAPLENRAHCKVRRAGWRRSLRRTTPKRKRGR